MGTTVSGDNCQRTNCQRKLSELFLHWDNCKILQFYSSGSWSSDSCPLWQKISDSCLLTHINQPCAQRAHRNPSTDVYSPNVGSIYPIQIYTLQTVHSWAHRNPPTDTFPQLLVWYIQHQYINTTDMYSANLNTNINITKYIYLYWIYHAKN